MLLPRRAENARGGVRELNESDAFGLSERGLAETEIRIGVGLNFGVACVGNMGSEKRFNYSAMGDVVNVSARIESATKAFGTDILVSEEVAKAASGIATVEAGEILLKGKSIPSKLYAWPATVRYCPPRRTSPNCCAVTHGCSQHWPPMMRPKPPKRCPLVVRLRRPRLRGCTIISANGLRS